MILLKSIWALLVIGSQVYGTPLPNNRPAGMQMTAQSHPMLASVFGTANNANMIDFSNRQFKVQTATKGSSGGWADGTPGNRDGSNRIGVIKDIPKDRGDEFGTGFQGHVEKTKIHSVRHSAKGIDQGRGGKTSPNGPSMNEPSIAIVDTLAGGICAYCQQSQNITCMQIYCLNEAPAASRDLLTQGNMMVQDRANRNTELLRVPADGKNIVPFSEKVNRNIPRDNINVKRPTNMAVSNGQFIPFEMVEPVNIGQVHTNSRAVIGSADAGSMLLSNTFGKTGSQGITAHDAPVNDVISHQHLHPTDTRPMRPFEVLPADVQPRPDFVPIDTDRPPVVPEFPFPNKGVPHSGNTGGAILPIAPKTPFTNSGDPNPFIINTAITDVNSFMQGQMSAAQDFPFSNMGVPHSGNEFPMLPVAPENTFANVGAPNHSIMDSAINDANTFQRGNTDPNAISFDNEFRQSDTQLAPSNGILPERPHFDTVFQQGSTNAVDPSSRTHNHPSDIMPLNNQQPSFDSVQVEAMRPFEGLQSNGIVNNIRNTNLADIPGDVQTSIVPMNVPSARPFDAMNPLTGINEATLPQAAGNQNNVQPIVPNVAVVSSAQDFFALKPHSRITSMQRHTPVAANEFLLNDMNQPMQTFAELNKKINDLHLPEHRSSNLFIETPVQPGISSINVQPAMVGQDGVVQTSTVLPTDVTMVTMSPKRKAELNNLSRTFLTNIVL